MSSTDPASLDNLQDIVEPPAVSWWPPAIGWWVLGAVFLLALAVWAYRAWRQWRAAAYRRAALAELQSATRVRDISALLKRTALTAYPRTEIASLSGVAWVRWLGQTGGAEVPPAIAESLTVGVFAPRAGQGVTEVAGFAAQWIQQHQAVLPGDFPDNSAVAPAP